MMMHRKPISVLLSMLLALLCLFAFVSCGSGDNNTPGDGNNGDNTPTGLAAFVLTANSADPTKITTLTEYKTSDETLSGRYVMEIEGENSIFTYEYQRRATVEEMNEDGPIVTENGTVYAKDGRFSTDGEVWESQAPAASMPLTFAITEECLQGATISEDGRTLTLSLTGAENITRVLGASVAENAKGAVSLTITTNGVHLTGVMISYETVNDAEVTVETSYSYNSISLNFPGEA